MSANYMRCVQFDVSVLNCVINMAYLTMAKKKKIPKNPVMFFRDVVDIFGVNKMKKMKVI